MRTLNPWPIAMLGAVLVATPALAQTAQTHDDVPTLGVSYHDLDLTTAKGRARLDMRLERAAAMVCGNGDGMHPAISDRAAYDCYNAAMTKARIAAAAAQHQTELVRR